MVLVVAIPVALVVALVALLIILGGQGFVRLFNATVGQLPLVGGYLSQIMTVAFDATRSTLIGWGESAAIAVADAAGSFVMWVWSIGAVGADAMGSAVAAIGRVGNRLSISFADLANRIVVTATNATNLAWAVWGTAQGWFNTAESFASGLVASLRADAIGWVNNAVSVLSGSIAATAATAAAEASAAESAAIGEAQSLFNQAEARISAIQSATMGAVTALGGEVVTEIAGAEAHAIAVAGTLATTAATGAIDVLDQAAHDLVLGPWAALLPELGTIVEHLPADVAQAIPGLEALPRALPVTVPGILSVLAPAIAGVATETARCTVPMCENLGGLSNLFAGLRDAAFLGLLVALMEEAVHNPGGFAATVQEDLYGPAKAAYDAARDLVGV